MTTPDEVRQRIMQAPPPVTDGVLAELRAIPHVAGVRHTWFHSWVEIDVDLDEWDWDAFSRAHEVIDDFGREHVESFSVVGHVNVPAP